MKTRMNLRASYDHDPVACNRFNFQFSLFGIALSTPPDVTKHQQTHPMNISLVFRLKWKLSDNDITMSFIQIEFSFSELIFRRTERGVQDNVSNASVWTVHFVCSIQICVFGWDPGRFVFIRESCLWKSIWKSRKTNVHNYLAAMMGIHHRCGYDLASDCDILMLEQIPPPMVYYSKMNLILNPAYWMYIASPPKQISFWKTFNPFAFA